MMIIVFMIFAGSGQLNVLNVEFKRFFLASKWSECKVPRWKIQPFFIDAFPKFIIFSEKEMDLNNN